MDTIAVVLSEPEQLTLSRLDLLPPTKSDIVVDVEWSGISTGTERSVLVRSHAAFPGNGISAGAWIRVGRPRFVGRS